MKEFALRLAREVCEDLAKKHGPPPPGFMESLAAKLSMIANHAPHGGLLVIGCVCSECQTFRVEALRATTEFSRTLPETIFRNARMPSMN